MTSFSEEVRRGRAPAAAGGAMLIAKRQISDEKLKQIWGTKKARLSIKLLIILIGLMFGIQLLISAVLGGTVFTDVTGDAIFPPYICIVGLLIAVITQISQRTWTLVAGMMLHCFCSAATSAYAFMFFFTVLGIDKEDEDMDINEDFSDNNIAPIWGLLCLIYMTISFIFLCYTIVSLHDIFSRLFPSELDMYFHEIYRLEAAEEGRILLGKTKFISVISGNQCELI